jgi:hypothetical protein
MTPFLDKNHVRPLAWLPLIMLFVTACVRSASTPTPGLDISSAAPAPSPASGSVSFPLAQASTWIYEYRTYAEDQQAVWIVTETIISVEQHDGLLIAQAERLSSLSDSQADNALLTAPSDGVFWYILRDTELFRQTEALNIAELSKNTTLEMVFPPDSLPCWPVSDALGPLERGTSGCRYVNAVLPTYETSSGTFEGCFELVTPYLSGAEFDVFCPNIGFVSGKYDHMGSAFGYEYVLTGYSLQSP